MENYPEKSLTTRVKTVRFIFALLALLLFICVVLQVFLAGMAIFVDGNWSMHKIFAIYLDKLPIGLFLLSFFGTIRGSMRWLSLAVYVMISFQFMTIHVFNNIGMVAAFHTIMALLLFWSTMHIMKQSWKWLRF